MIETNDPVKKDIAKIRAFGMINLFLILTLKKNLNLIKIIKITLLICPMNLIKSLLK